MRNLSVVTLGLIAGILSSSVAQYSYNSVSTSTTTPRIYPGVADVFILLLRAKDVVRNFREDCHSYGGIDAFDTFKTKVAKVVDTAKPVVMTLLEAIARKDAGGKQGAVNLVGLRLCSLIPNFSIAIKEMMTSYENCLEPNIRDDVDSDGGVIVPLLEYACQNQAILTDIELNRDQCAKIDETAFLHCLNRTEAMAQYTDQKIAELLINLLTSALSLEDCQYIENFRLCVDGSLNNCASTKYRKFVDDVVGITEQHTPCLKLLDDHRRDMTDANSMNSSPDTVNVLSITSLVLLLATSLFV